jgi:hypothetical protein
MCVENFGLFKKSNLFGGMDDHFLAPGGRMNDQFPGAGGMNHQIAAGAERNERPNPWGRRNERPIPRENRNVKKAGPPHFFYLSFF